MQIIKDMHSGLKVPSLLKVCYVFLKEVSLIIVKFCTIEIFHQPFNLCLFITSTYWTVEDEIKGIFVVFLGLYFVFSCYFPLMFNSE